MFISLTTIQLPVDAQEKYFKIECIEELVHNKILNGNQTIKSGGSEVFLDLKALNNQFNNCFF